MTFALFLAIGIASGIPIGALAGRFFYSLKNGCAAVDAHGDRCGGMKSGICVDNLCAEHCKRIHDGKCVDILRS